jgi:hypothetical protein
VSAWSDDACKRLLADVRAGADGDRYGEHATAEAVICHLASVDHDQDEHDKTTSLEPLVAPPTVSDAAQALHDASRDDGVCAEAIGQLGTDVAVRIYLAERERLRAQGSDGGADGGSR